MANISRFIAEFKESPSGYFARKPIIRILTEINEIGGDGTSLDGHTSEDLLRREEFFSSEYLDSVPIHDSVRAVKSGGLFNVFGDVRKIDMYEPFER